MVISAVHIQVAVRIVGLRCFEESFCSLLHFSPLDLAFGNGRRISKKPLKNSWSLYVLFSTLYSLLRYVALRLVVSCLGSECVH
jgi:hypothetical protein